ncbi:very short patch repair endonuclease [Halobacillus kuroshimensis]|uniref:Very short patch repair endonuclease n=1 Tax=Halobacillus kuroshimensis TaxID=302481 RepID=A0ABS3DYM0_9BACI|nr:very short patch repair endonuclease [Halobacillus kuroshimensis]MBN8236414.1 very short patch repair endonuclease [Halobacillus kuroshimensis]
MDNLTKEQRRKNMKNITSRSKVEDRVSQELWRRGYRFRKNNKKLFGKPDISIKKYKVVIFIDSCFWHVCPEHSNMPSTNRDFWEKKLNRNVERDKEVNEYYKSQGWHIMRVWEHDLKKKVFNQTVNHIQEFIETNKSKESSS